VPGLEDDGGDDDLEEKTFLAEWKKIIVFEYAMKRRADGKLEFPNLQSEWKNIEQKQQEERLQRQNAWRKLANENQVTTSGVCRTPADAEVKAMWDVLAELEV
jgi:hypothetical protein